MHRLHTAHEVHGVYNTCSTDKVIFLLIETERRKIPEISLSVFLNSVPKGSQDELASTRKDQLFALGKATQILGNTAFRPEKPQMGQAVICKAT